MKRLKKHKSFMTSEGIGDVLEFLSDAGVFEIAVEEGAFVFMDGCDQWYGAELTREDMMKLAAELKTLAGMTP